MARTNINGGTSSEFLNLLALHSQEFHEANDHRQRTYGQWFTRVPIASLLCSALCKSRGPRAGRTGVSILDAGAGVGTLGFIAAFGMLTEGVSVHCTFVEVDRRAEHRLRRIGGWLSANFGNFSFSVSRRDFIDWDSRGDFDMVISNPPYAKIPMSAAADYGSFYSPNLYSSFMLKCSSVMKKKGVALFIVPRSFANGQYFTAFRREMFSTVHLESVHLFGDRGAQFYGNPTQEVVALIVADRMRKKIEIVGHGREASLSTRFHVDRGDVYCAAAGGKMVMPISRMQLKAWSKMRQQPSSLSALGLEVVTGSVVPFREKVNRRGVGVPVYHVNELEGLGTHAPQTACYSVRGRGVCRGTSVLIGRLVGRKGDVLSYPVRPMLASEDFLFCAENHINVIRQREMRMSDAQMLGISALLHSTWYRTAMGALLGNTQMNASDMGMLMFPSEEVLSLLGEYCFRLFDGGLSEDGWREWQSYVDVWLAEKGFAYTA